MPVRQKIPPWLKQRVSPLKLTGMQRFLKERNIETVCESGLCPNRGECYVRGTVTFMILNSVCTRNCKFCAVEKGSPGPLDPKEPFKISQAVKALKLKHAVITSVTRDDLSDGGASQFAEVIKEVKKNNLQTIIEILVPDFQGSYYSVKKVIEAGPHIFNHNLDTIPRLYPEIKPGSDYRKRLRVLETAKEINPGIITKSGLMLGLGEAFEEVKEVMDDLRKINCDILTLGQYLAPTLSQYPIKDFIHPETFDCYKRVAFEKGFSHVASGPWVRSSYYAEKINI